MRLSDVTNQAIQGLIGFRSVAKAALAIGTVTSGINTGAMTYVNNGVFLTKGALTSQSIVPTTGLSYNLPAGINPATGLNYTMYVTLGLDGLGNVVVLQGTYAGQVFSTNPSVGVGVSQAGTSYVGDGSIPDVPAGVTPFGVVKIVNATNPFILGTTLLGAAGVTALFFDVAVLPIGKL